jgi:hypothetical protein
VYANGAIHIQGTATAWGADFFLTRNNPIKLQNGKAYTLSGMAEKDGIAPMFVYKDENGTLQYKKTFIWKDSYTFSYIYVGVAPNKPVDTIVYPMLNEGETAKPFEPYNQYYRIRN